MKPIPPTIAKTRLSQLTDRELSALFMSPAPDKFVKRRRSPFVTREQILAENAPELAFRLLKIARIRLRRHRRALWSGTALILLLLFILLIWNSTPFALLGSLPFGILFAMCYETMLARRFERTMTERLGEIPGAEAHLAQLELTGWWWKLDEPDYVSLTQNLSRLNPSDRTEFLKRGEKKITDWFKTLNGFWQSRPAKDRFFCTLLKLIAEDGSLRYLDAVYRLTRLSVKRDRPSPILHEAERTLEILTAKLREGQPKILTRYLNFKNQSDGDTSAAPGFADATCLYTVMRLLPELDAEAARRAAQNDPVCAEKWLVLYRQLVNAVPAVPGKFHAAYSPFMHYPPEFFTVLLDYIERSRDSNALSSVRLLAKRSLRNPVSPRLKERAKLLVPMLEEELKRGQTNAILLRPSQAPSDLLLHPIFTPPSAKDEERMLLRSSNHKADEVQEIQSAKRE